MVIESISNDVAKTYRAPETSKPATQSAKPEFTTEAANVKADNSDPNKEGLTAEEKLKGNAPSESTIKQAVSDINKKINPNTIAEYGYHEDTNRVTIKIVDKETEKTIKEFPAEETLDMIAKVWELAGMILDEKG